MNQPAQIPASILLAGIFAAAALQPGFSQTSNAVLRISRTPTNVVISWTNRGTLQSATTLGRTWQDLLEAPNPFRSGSSNTQKFFRLISRWSTRSNLLEANSEMAVAELDGKINVRGNFGSLVSFGAFANRSARRYWSGFRQRLDSCARRWCSDRRQQRFHYSSGFLGRRTLPLNP
jgi:hypothetical protein